MSEKRLDAKNRWRNVVVAFRMSPEEAQELNVKVSLSGLSKQDYIIQCLLKHEIRVVGGMKVAKKVQVHLDTILEELQTLDDVLFSSDNFLSARYFVVLRVLVRFTSSLFRRVFLRNQSPVVAAVFELLVVGFQLSTSQYLIIEKSLCSYLVDHIILRFLYLYIF